MELLKILKLTQYHRNNRNNPALQHRIKLAADISEQIQLPENPNYKQISIRTVAVDSGEVRKVELRKHVLRWMRVGADGTVELTVRYGSMVLELVKVIDDGPFGVDDGLHKLRKGFSPIVATKVC